MATGVQIATGLIEKMFAIIRSLLRFIRVSFVPLVTVIAVICIISIVVSGMTGLIGLAFAGPVIAIFGPESYLISTLGYISLYFLIGIPILGLIAFFLRIAFKTRIPKEVNFVAWTLWFIALFFMFYAGTMTAIDYKHGARKITSADFTMPAEEIFIKNWDENLSLQDFSGYVHVPLKFFKDSMFFHNVQVEYKETDSPFVTIQKQTEARGFNEEKAQERANTMDAPFTVVGNQILISPLVRMPKDAKWRGNQVRYTIHVPKGKKVIYEFTRQQNNSIHVGWKD